MAVSDADATKSTLFGRLRDEANEQAWAEFVQRYGPKIFRWCVQEGASAADAEEIMQRLFVRLHRTLQTFEYDRTKGSFRAWLRRVTVNAWKDMAGEIDKHRGMGGSRDPLEGIVAKPPPSFDDVFDSDIVDLAKAHVQQQVSQRDWGIFLRCCQDEQSTKEIAGETGITVAAAYMVVYRVKNHLKQAIRLLEGNEA